MVDKNIIGRKMKELTIGQAAAGVAFLVALIGGWIQLKKWTTQAIKDVLKEELKAIKTDISDLHDEILKEDKEKTKNFLVSMLADIERGNEWGDIERQRFYEQYDHYVKDLNGNTYIKTAVQQHEQNGKIWRQQNGL